MGSMVVVGDVEGNVIALDKESGRVIWLYEFGDLASILSGPAAIDTQLVVAADETGRLALLRADSGREIWTADLGSPVEAGLAVGHGLIYVPTARGRFVALHAEDGTIAWEHRSDSDQVRFTAAAVTDDYVIFGGTDGILRSLRAENGASVWTFHTDGTIAAAPVVNGSIVFVGAMDEKVYAVHLDNGSIQWEMPVRGRVKSSPAVRNGYLIVMSEPRYIYAFTNAANIEE
jgi:outer membrane protein assembly factor BamB